ncbi:hypothetical protein WN943_015864 [Citrus x changshan-huyou]
MPYPICNVESLERLNFSHGNLSGSFQIALKECMGKSCAMKSLKQQRVLMQSLALEMVDMEMFIRMSYHLGKSLLSRNSTCHFLGIKWQIINNWTQKRNERPRNQSPSRYFSPQNQYFGPPNNGVGRPNKGKGRGRPHGAKKTVFKPGVFCQICHKEGHTADECWYRKEDDFKPKPQNCQPRGVFLATNEGNSEPGCYLDSGATNHVINDLNNLSVRSEYEGQIGECSLQGIDIGGLFQIVGSQEYVSPRKEFAVLSV